MTTLQSFPVTLRSVQRVVSTATVEIQAASQEEANKVAIDAYNANQLEVDWGNEDLEDSWVEAQASTSLVSEDSQ